MSSQARIQNLPLSFRALWNMRLPALIVCAPVAGLCLLDLFYGLPSKLWLLAGGFFVFSLVLLGTLVRGEARRLRQTADHR
ncbi:MAG: hypothetical protein PF501_19335 [Salinisphaera sp.]|jgi:hypothetical protein|nr:hypothetical protein [Salinisphaera sp.]